MEKRTCGGCTMCCRTMSVDAIAKPRDKWCPECAIGVGCKIYDTRPELCRTFECVWLQDKGGLFPDRARPDRSYVVVQPTDDGYGLIAHCRVDAPFAWREPDIYKALHACAAAGYHATARAGGRYWAIGANGYLEIPAEWMRPRNPDNPTQAINVNLPHEIAVRLGIGEHAPKIQVGRPIPGFRGTEALAVASGTIASVTIKGGESGS